MATGWLLSEPIILGLQTSRNNAQGRSVKSYSCRPTLRFEVVVMVVVLVSLGGTRTVVAQGSPTSTVDPNQGNPCSIQWFEAHGWLMWLAFGVFFPIGILVSRVGQYYFRQWCYAHIALQVLLALARSPICYQKRPPLTWDSSFGSSTMLRELAFGLRLSLHLSSTPTCSWRYFSLSLLDNLLPQTQTTTTNKVSFVILSPVAYPSSHVN